MSNKREVRSYRGTKETPRFQAADSEIPSPTAKMARIQAQSFLTTRLRAKYAAEITCLDFCAKAGLLATGSNDKSARLWKTPTLELLAVPLLHDTTVNCVRLSPDGLRLATSTAAPLTRVRIWDVQTGQPLTDSIPSEQRVAAVDFSADASWVITDAGWKWRLFPLSRAAPSWLADLAEAIGGLRYTPSGLTIQLEEQAVVDVCDRLSRLAGSDALTLWVKDLLRAGGRRIN
jgi:WD40 repeat protein